MFYSTDWNMMLTYVLCVCVDVSVVVCRMSNFLFVINKLVTIIPVSELIINRKTIVSA